MKSVFLLGATGSIGLQVLEIIGIHQDEFQVKSLSFWKNIIKGREIIEKVRPEFVSVMDEQTAKMLKKEYPSIHFGFGDQGLVDAATYSKDSGVLVNAVVGMVGLMPTLAAIQKGRDVLLANKETLVVAGTIVMQEARKHQVRIFPIDSEHSAITQCLLSGKQREIARIVLTASGGTFRDHTREQLNTVTKEEALKHPNWLMGAKITVDSATMVNKGLEIIEAHHLFGVPYEQIDTVLHRESIIHSMVEFIDGSTIAQLSNPDMRIPIQYALSFPNRWTQNYVVPMDYTKSMNWSFEPVDTKRYPCVEWAYEVGNKAGIMPAVYNASNEAAVQLFLEGKISFLEIEKIIFDAITQEENIESPTLKDIMQADQRGREKILKNYEVKNT